MRVLIATQAQRMVDLGNRSGRPLVGPVVFSLGTIAKVRRVAAPLARASGRSVLVDVVQPVSVEAAEDDIHRVLQNLMQNGLRHAGGNCGHDSGRPHARGQACCRVMDAGDSVPEELLPRIFDRGVRSNSAGHGLGLSIALRLSERWR